MGRELNKAFARRQLGDYGHTFVITKAEAEEVLRAGGDFVKNSETYLKEYSG